MLYGAMCKLRDYENSGLEPEEVMNLREIHTPDKNPTVGQYMGKQIKKASQKRQKVSKFQRICERCGNEVFSPKRVFRCRYCGWMNGILERNNE